MPVNNLSRHLSDSLKAFNTEGRRKGVERVIVGFWQVVAGRA